MDLLIRKKNEVYLKVDAEPGLNYELSDFFTFEVKSAKFMQRQEDTKDGMVRYVCSHQQQEKYIVVL